MNGIIIPQEFRKVLLLFMCLNNLRHKVLKALVVGKNNEMLT